MLSNSREHVAKYDDNNVERINPNNEEKKFIQSGTLKSLVCIIMVTSFSNAREDLSEMFTSLGSTTFFRYNTQAFHQALLI